MKKIAILASLLTITSFAQVQAAEEKLQVDFANDNTSKWNGIVIPKDQQCKFYDGVNPTTPKLIVNNIPSGATSLVFVYSDYDYTPMNNGGHGIFEYDLSATPHQIEVPSIPSNTFDLPKNFKVIAEHRGTSKGKAGAYMPPCSGGRNHNYFVTVQAIKNKSVISETVLKLGEY